MEDWFWILILVVIICLMIFVGIKWYQHSNGKISVGEVYRAYNESPQVSFTTPYAQSEQGRTFVPTTEEPLVSDSPQQDIVENLELEFENFDFERDFMKPQLQRFLPEDRAQARKQLEKDDKVTEIFMERIILNRRQSILKDLKGFETQLKEDEQNFNVAVLEYINNQMSTDPRKYVSVNHMFPYPRDLLQNMGKGNQELQFAINMLTQDGKTYPFYRDASIVAYNILSGNEENVVVSRFFPAPEKDRFTQTLSFGFDEFD